MSNKAEMANMETITASLDTTGNHMVEHMPNKNVPAVNGKFLGIV